MKNVKSEQLLMLKIRTSARWMFRNERNTKSSCSRSLFAEAIKRDHKAQLTIELRINILVAYWIKARLLENNLEAKLKTVEH